MELEMHWLYSKTFEIIHSHSIIIVVTKTTAWAAAKCLFSRVTKVKMNKKRNNDIQKLLIAR